MAISNLNNELYEDDVMTEEVTSASFSDYVPESPIKKPEEIKESFLDDLKNAASDIAKTLGSEGDIDVKGILKGILNSSTEDGTSSEGSSSSSGDDETLRFSRETLEKLANIIAEGDLEERADFCRENFPPKLAEKLLQKICGFNEKESKFIIEN